MKPIRVATICHNEDDHIGPNHRRVRLELHKKGRAYVWCDESGEDLQVVPHEATVYDAEIAAIHGWGASEWDLRAKWFTR